MIKQRKWGGKQLKITTSLGEVLGLVYNAKPTYFLILSLFNILQGIIPAITLWIGKLIIDNLVQGIGGSQGEGKTLGLLIFLLFINILANGISSISIVIQTVLGDIVSNRINISVIEKSLSLDLSHYENPLFYDMLTRAQREASTRPLTMVSQLFDLIRNLIALASLIFVLFRLQWIAVIILAATSIPQALAQRKYAHKGYSLFFSQTQDSRKMLYFKDILTSISFFKEIKLFNLGKYFLDKYRTLFDKIFSQNRQLVIKKNISLFIFSLLSTLNYIGFFAYTIYCTMHKIISLGDLTLYSGAFSQCQARFNGIVNNMASLYENNLFVNNLFSFLNLESKIISPSLPINLLSPLQKGITFHDVSFRYPGTSRPILKNLSFHIKPNESIAFVGDNGAGKTTVVKLLTRLYDPDCGEVLLDGVNIRSLDPGKYQDRIGVIFQDFSRFYLTARENIGLSWVNEIYNMRRIMEASSTSGADRVIEGLPHGYDSVLGRYFNEGNELSIGEWQKIAIARAFMRNCEILILDEPTASVDVKTEHDIFQRFEELTKGRICILISHRFSTVRMANRIFVLEDGTLIEQGTHADLMKLGKKYAKMFSMQSEIYT